MVVFIDFDYFKGINDMCLYEVGDEVFWWVVVVFDGMVYGIEGVFVVRMGGEEFFVVFLDVDLYEVNWWLEFMCYIIEML